jgi:hypothetical protein
MSDLHVKVGLEWMRVEIVSEPYVVMSFHGYAPVVDAKVGDAVKVLFINSKSISQGLDPFVQSNGGRFSGIVVKMRKENPDKMAPYLVESA